MPKSLYKIYALSIFWHASDYDGFVWIMMITYIFFGVLFMFTTLIILNAVLPYTLETI